jgi:hypothetical protein
MGAEGRKGGRDLFGKLIFRAGVIRSDARRTNDGRPVLRDAPP